MRREQVQPETDVDNTARTGIRDFIILFTNLTILILTYLQIWLTDRIETVSENGDIVSKFEGIGVLPYLFNHLNPEVVTWAVSLFCVVLGVVTIVFIFHVFGAYLISLPFLMLAILFMSVSPVEAVSLMDDTEGKAEAYVAYQNIDDASIQFANAGKNDLLTLKSSLGSESLGDLSDKDSVQLMLVQEKNNGMRIYSVSEDVKDVDDFVLLGTVEHDDRLQVKSFFNSLDGSSKS